MDAYIEFRNVVKKFDDFVALDHVSLQIPKGAFVTLLGPSGCGKTTTLRVVSGLEKPQNGFIYMDGKEIVNAAEAYYAPPSQRNLNLVFQSYALWPHMTVFENVSFGLKIKKIPSAEIEKMVASALERMQIGQYAKRYPTELSGGQQQRVAIARALVNRPKVLLLDEPLGALDLRLRKDMQIELKRIQQQMGITFVYVTHDQEEALTMSDTVVVMDKGRIQQIGTPEDIYNEPKNAFVADFIGESNILNGTMVRDNVVKMYGKEFPCVDGGFAPNEPVDVVIRPEDIDIVPVEQGQLAGTVTNVTFKGMQYDIIVDFRASSG